jgi:WD40 repeat protein
MDMVTAVFLLFLHGAFFNAGGSPFRQIGPQRTDVKDFLVCNEGQKLYVAYRNAVNIYEIETGEHLGTVDFGTGGNIHSLALSKNNALLAAGFCDGHIKIRNLDNGWSNQIRCTENLITSIDICQDRQVIVAGTIKGEIFIMGPDGNEIRPLDLHNDAITRLVISADGSFFGSTGLDGRAYMTWLDDSEKSILISEGRSPCRDIIFSECAGNILVAYQDGKVRYFRHTQAGSIVKTGAYRLGGWVTGIDYADDGITWAGCTTNGFINIQTIWGIRYSVNLKRSVNKVLFVQRDDQEITVIASLYNAGLSVINGFDMKIAR